MSHWQKGNSNFIYEPFGGKQLEVESLQSMLYILQTQKSNYRTSLEEDIELMKKESNEIMKYILTCRVNEKEIIEKAISIVNSLVNSL